MAKIKSIADQLQELQNSADQLKKYQKLFDKACQINFDMSAKSIKKIIENNDKNCSDFEKKICNYFNLNSTSEKEKFISIICTNNILSFYNSEQLKDVSMSLDYKG